MSQNKVLQQKSNINLGYIENKGQWNKKVTFLTCVKNINAWVLNNGGILVDFYKVIPNKKSSTFDYKFNETKSNDSLIGHRFFFNWLNGNKDLIFKGFNKHPEYYNYLIGKDVAKNASNVGLYDELTAENLYQGIDIKYYHPR